MDNTLTPKRTSINRVFLLNMALVGCLSIISIGYLWISHEWSSFKKETDQMRETNMESYKKNLKLEVNQALAFVRYMQAQTEDRLKDSIQRRVYEAYAIADNIQKTHQNTKNSKEIEALIKDALRPVRFNNGRGYYFAFTLNGIETLFAVRPEMEGRNMLSVKGGKGEFVVADMLALINKNEEGFYKYTWSKPNQEGYFPKIAFVKKIEPLGWVLGTGEYLDNVTKDIQNECIRWISSIKFSNEGFIFVGQWDGLSLSGPDAGRNMLDFQDVNGLRIFRQLIQAAKSGGGFVDYALPISKNIKQSSLSIDASIPMISYAVGLPEWRWYIGAKKSLSDIEQSIALKNAELEQDIKTHIRNIFMVIFVLLIFICLVVKFLSNRIRDNMSLFSNFFSKASLNAVRIDRSALHFSEFAKLADSANEMVDKRQRAEKALRESEEKYRTLFMLSNIGILLIKDVIFDCNDAVCKFLMYEKSEIIGKSPKEFSAPREGDNGGLEEDKGRLWKPDGARKQKLFEWRCLRKDGHVADIEVTLKSVFIGSENYLLATGRDITEFKRAKKMIAESEERLRVFIENSPDTFIVHHLDGTILKVNEQACKNLGYSREELIGMNVMDIETGGAPEKSAKLWHKTAGGAVASYEGEYRKKDGGTYPVDVKMSSIRLNEEILVLGFIRDITERKELEKEKEKYQHQLMHSQKMESIGTLAGGIAHDFNNLLMGIQGRVSLLALDLQSSHPGIKHIDAIMEYTKNASNLTKQMLGMARGGKYEVKPVDINEVLCSSSEMFGRTQKEIRIHTSLHEPPPAVAADRSQLEQVLLNLYINAGHAMPEGGELFLETFIVDLNADFCRPYGVKPGRYARLVVKDNGIGMDKETCQQIFDPFFTTRNKRRGTGMGLASAYGIIKNHSGIIMVDSAVGRGTAFTIYLPVSSQPAKPEKPAKKNMIKGTETIMIVDDEIMILDVGRHMLERLGYQVVTADNGKRAVDAIKENTDEIDMVLLDMIMPGMDGGKTFDLIRKIKPEIPILLSSGYALDEQAEKIMQRGCNGFIQKPFQITELSQKIRKILDSNNLH